MILTAKCAVDGNILKLIEKAGIEAVELYTKTSFLKKKEESVKICRDFPFSYAVHAPTNGFEPDLLAEFVSEIKAKIVILHNIYWMDEWSAMAKALQEVNAKFCVENIVSLQEPFKIMRRFDAGYCIDLEHLQMEICGLNEETMFHLFKRVSHVHMTGYSFGSQAWHTPLHHNTAHSTYLLNLLKKAGYEGMVVSEASTQYQTASEFVKLQEFYKKWQETHNN